MILLKGRKGKKKTVKKIDDDSSNNVKIEFLLTKDKILELQTKDSFGIKTFINSLPFFGNEISLIKHRPNKEKYPVGKAQEPSIKIDISNFTKRIDVKLKENPALYKKVKNMRTEFKQRANNENNLSNINLISSISYNNENNDKNGEEINKDSIGNTSSLMNIFDIKSIKTIKYIDFFIHIFIILSITIEFILSLIFLNDNIQRFKSLSNSYKILSNIDYTKYFITEAILVNLTNSNYFHNKNVSPKEYISYIKSELGNYREEFSELFGIFVATNIKFSKEFSNYVSKTIINITTLTNGIKTNDGQPFNSALTKLTNALFYISTLDDNKIIDMNNKYAYELMLNLLNGYYMSFEQLTIILFNDFKIKTKKYPLTNIIIFIITITISILYIIIFWKMMTKLDYDREKPINLFLTIKKNIFEDLKASSENFSNKLLNKFFGNEEDEEESQKEYISNIKPNDINIAKFKALNEYKSSISKESSFFNYFIQLIILFIIVNLFILLKYINAVFYFKDTAEFIEVYNQTQFSHNYLVLRIDVIKQYLFNDSIPNFNSVEKHSSNFFSFFHCFKNISYQFEESLIISSKIDSFLGDEYRNTFKQYFYNDFKDIAEFEEFNKEILFNNTNKLENGFKQIALEIFERLRFLSIQYFINGTRNEYNYISNLVYDNSWYYIDKMLLRLVRPWYKSIIEIMDSFFFNFVENIKVLYISYYIVLVVVISLYYWIIWKRYEENFITLMKKSFDLLNLIPEEIKNIIVQKLNE